MSTPRRALGVGPMSTTTAPTQGRSPRLLPAELADTDHDQDPEPTPGRTPEAGGSGRRTLGTRGRQHPGAASSPD
ncbi:hypothetical protein [Streptomyces sp. NPDC059894]|uniref:hypothetical protein n=1 Tax=unclassified Streptomyces TaxID=2593676 RepID=UPI00365CF8B4